MFFVLLSKSVSSTLYNIFIKNVYKCIHKHIKTHFKKQFKYDELINFINISLKNKELFIIDSYRIPIDSYIGVVSMC